MRLLVIKLGALGDFVLAFPAFAAIRARHPGAEITLLTTAPFRTLAEAAPWFDRVVVDSRPAPWDLAGLLRLRGLLRGFDFVYDLQTSARSSRYRILAGRPPWSGIASGASHRHSNPERDRMHTLERQRDQLEAAGITTFPPPDLQWLTSGGPAIPPPYAVLAPGSAPHRPEKRWPVRRFAALAALLHDRGLRPVVVGSGAESSLATPILDACPNALDLTGRTSLLDLGGVFARAAFAVGNDTGPMHIAAAVGCPSVVLFSGASDPALTAPRGPKSNDVTVLRAPDLAALAVERVAASLPDRHDCAPVRQTEPDHARHHPA